MPTQIKNQTVVRGDTWVMSANYIENGDPVDLTGYSFRAYVRADFDAPTPLLEFDVAIDIPGGIATFRLDPPATQGITGKYRYDVEETNADGVVSTIFWGELNVMPDVSW